MGIWLLRCNFGKRLRGYTFMTGSPPPTLSLCFCFVWPYTYAFVFFENFFYHLSWIFFNFFKNLTRCFFVKWSFAIISAWFYFIYFISKKGYIFKNSISDYVVKLEFFYILFSIRYFLWNDPNIFALCTVFVELWFKIGGFRGNTVWDCYDWVGLWWKRV